MIDYSDYIQMRRENDNTPNYSWESSDEFLDCPIHFWYSYHYFLFP